MAEEIVAKGEIGFVPNDPFSLPVQIKVEGVAQNTTGWTWETYVWRGGTDGSRVNAGVVTAVDEVTGRYTVDFTAEQTALWWLDNLILRRTDGSNDRTWMKLSLIPEVVGTNA